MTTRAGLSALTTDELHALMGLVIDKIARLTPGNTKAEAFYGTLDRKLTLENAARWAEHEASNDHDCGKGEWCPEFGTAFKAAKNAAKAENDGFYNSESAEAIRFNRLEREALEDNQR